MEENIMTRLWFVEYEIVTCSLHSRMIYSIIACFSYYMCQYNMINEGKKKNPLLIALTWWDSNITIWWL